MSEKDIWSSILDGHPIFSIPRNVAREEDLELSFDTLPTFSFNTSEDASSGPNPMAGRKQIMCMKDSDLIVACGSEIRMTSLGDAKVSGGSKRNYKILHTPNISFDIKQICLCPNRKLLAVAGMFEVAVIVLPRTGYSKMVTARIDCKSLQVGQRYHSTLPTSPPIAKIDWHPWGEAGSTLLVMTIDGVLREYDVSYDPEEPQATLEFFQDKRNNSISLDGSDREVASFTFGKGKADWGPLTLYAVTRSGDVYAICPYMPQHASIPSTYISALECYVSAKQEFLTSSTRKSDTSFSTLYDYQRKFVNNLMKQLPPGVPSITRSVQVQAPSSLTGKPAVQGPFLMQPAPVELDGVSDGEATDLMYIVRGSSFTEDENDDMRERLGILLLVYQDGRVDVCLDVEKVEARWESDRKHARRSLPSLSVYETIDLGLVHTLTSHDKHGSDLTELLQGNHPVLHQDPIYDDTVYIYHAFGAHSINVGPFLNALGMALKEENEAKLSEALDSAGKTSVKALLQTFNSHQKSSSPIAAVAIPGDIYLTYSIFILTTTMRIVSFPLNLRTDTTDESSDSGDAKETSSLATSVDSTDVPPAGYACIIKAATFTPPPILQKQLGRASLLDIPLPKSHDIKSELVVTPETLRYLKAVAERICTQKHEAMLALGELKGRLALHNQEAQKQMQYCQEVNMKTQMMNGPKKAAVLAKMKSLQDGQQALLHRMDRVLQALINKASPELNDHETKWFDELRRMKGQVLGIGRYDQTSLKIRSQLLKNEYDRILPSLKAIEQQQRGTNGSLGMAHLPQSALLKKATTEERIKLEDAVKQITKLANKLEITSLGKPPVAPS